jgi:tRNA pseudouridine55 synthase
MDGLLLIDKPRGWTSFDVVAKVRGTLKKAIGGKPKVGHTGTLDPLATGLLVLTLGSYCKRAGEFSKLDKTYEVEMTLGKTSTTDDGEGDITEVSDKKPSRDELSTAVMSFVGAIEQVPPVFSAIKVNGKRAYKMAREGKEVKLEPRQAIIYAIENLEYTYPVANFTVQVSSGTYVRSLIRDIGQKLECGAYMSALQRTQVGEFSLESAITVENISEKDIQNNIIDK